MHFSNSLIMAVAAAQSVQAHWFFKCLTTPSDPNCVEGSHMNPYIDNHPDGTDWPRTTPLNSANDPNMQCGISGIPGDDITPINVNKDETLTAWFAHTANDPDYFKAIHSNHHGYTFVYLTPYNSHDQNQWTKIHSEGFVSNGDDVRAQWSDPDLNDSQGTQFVGWWSSDKMRMNGGTYTFSVPSGVPDGKYILRAEVLTNILRDTAVPTAQSYLGCVPIIVGAGASNDQSASLASVATTVNIPQVYANEVFVQSYDTFSDLSRNVPNTPGGDAWTGAASSKREVASAAQVPVEAAPVQPAALLRRSRQFHQHRAAVATA